MRAGRYARRVASMGAVSAMGQTESNFIAPTRAQFDANPPGAELAGATVAMLQHFARDGVPSEHAKDAFVLAFQQAYNKDPLRAATGSPVGLAEDGGFGDNSHAVAEVLAYKTPSLVVPDVNTSNATMLPAIDVPGTLPKKATPATPAKPAGESNVWPWVLGIGGAAIVMWFLTRKKRRGATHARATAPTVLVHANPLRRPNPHHVGMW